VQECVVEETADAEPATADQNEQQLDVHVKKEQSPAVKDELMDTEATVPKASERPAVPEMEEDSKLNAAAAAHQPLTEQRSGASSHVDEVGASFVAIARYGNNILIIYDAISVCFL
jgi:hypothetical protein